GSGVKQFLMEDAASELAAAVRAAAMGNARKMRGALARPRPSRPATTMPTAAQAVLASPPLVPHITERIVAVGTSTGGTQALEHLLVDLPRLSPGIVIVQHMPEKFTASFARRLNDLCDIEVREAAHGDRLRPGLALIAPGGRHMVLK